MFIVLLTSLINTYSPVNACNLHTFLSLSNQKYKIQPTFINLHPKEYSQQLHCYLFAVNLDRSVGG